MKHVIFRWIAVVVISLPLLISLSVGASYICEQLYIWPELFGGPVVAFLFVILISIAAPSHKLIAGILAFSLGAYIALWAPNMTNYPENHELAYTTTYVPLLCTYIGGLLALVVIAIKELYCKKSIKH